MKTISAPMTALKNVWLYEQIIAVFFVGRGRVETGRGGSRSNSILKHFVETRAQFPGVAYVASTPGFDDVRVRLVERSDDDFLPSAWFTPTFPPMAVVDPVPRSGVGT
jgi:hypothetical protein